MLCECTIVICRKRYVSGPLQFPCGCMRCVHTLSIFGPMKNLTTSEVLTVHAWCAYHSVGSKPKDNPRHRDILHWYLLCNQHFPPVHGFCILPAGRKFLEQSHPFCLDNACRFLCMPVFYSTFVLCVLWKKQLFSNCPANQMSRDPKALRSALS